MRSVATNKRCSGEDVAYTSRTLPLETSWRPGRSELIRALPDIACNGWESERRKIAQARTRSTLRSECVPKQASVLELLHEPARICSSWRKSASSEIHDTIGGFLSCRSTLSCPVFLLNSIAISSVRLRLNRTCTKPALRPRHPDDLLVKHRN